MENIALVVGSTGITGSNLAHELLSEGWTTYGLARNPNSNISGLIPVKADLLDIENLEKALENISPPTYSLPLGCEMTQRKTILK